ncbi:hypothetical protein, partial [Marinovum sp. 1_MG-2023]|uniref:hypothetical protein n=1 Tax=Marinovum sp. 1_MG-2023 TaxID=3062633 RepID=UPI0026E28D2F
TYTYTWAISDSASAWTRAEIVREAVDGLVQTLRGQLRVEVDNRAGLSLNKVKRNARVDGFDRGAAHVIYRQTLAPLEQVIADKAHLMVVF